MKSYNFTTYTPAAEQPEAQPPQTEQDRAHLFTPGAGVIIPICQALVTGLVFGALGTWASWKLKAPDPWGWGLGIFLLVQAASWLMLLWRWLGLTKPLERLTGLDLNRDGYIGSPPETVKIEFKSEDGRRVQYSELPAAKDKMADFARGVLAGQPISESRWSGAGALFSQNEFKAVRAELLARGWLRWVNPEYPTLGVELTGHGRAVMRGLAGENQAPSPALASTDPKNGTR